MSELSFRQVRDRLNRHRAAFVRLALRAPDEAAAEAVALIGVALGYRTVVLLRLDLSADPPLFASIGISAEQQARWQQSDRHGARLWRQLQPPVVLQIDALSPQDAALLAELGLSEPVLAVPLSTATSDATADSLLLASQPVAASDPALDLGLLELLALQAGAALSRSVYRMRRAAPVAPAQPQAERLPMLDTVAEQLEVVVFQTDAAGRITALSLAWPELTGFTIAQSIGAPLWEFVHLDDRDATRRLLGSVVKGCTALGRQQLRLITSAGAVRWVELSLSQIVDATGQAALGGMLSDIGERRRDLVAAAERQLFERLALGASPSDVLAPLVQLLEVYYPDGIGSVLVSDETGLIQRQSSGTGLPAPTSYSVAAGLAGPVSGPCSLEFADETPLVVADVLNDPRWTTYQLIAQVYDLRACWAQPFHDQQGQLLGLVLVYYRAPRAAEPAELGPLAEMARLAARAVERMRDELALRDREELFRLISENTTDHIGVLDSEGKYLYASPSLQASLGYHPSELLGVSAFAHVHPDDLAVTLASWNKVDEQGLVQSTFRYRTTHGTWRWFDAIGNVVSYRGARAFISVSRDITERRQAEQARQRLEAQLAQAQKMESIGTLAGGIAHDFNNILTAILGNVQLALLGMTPESPEHPLLEEIEKAATRAATLTRQLLTFSRYQQHERKAVDLNATISELLQMFRRLIGGSVEIAIELAPDLPLLVADPVQIEQVVLNLAVNARDAMPDGGQLLIATRTTVLDEVDCHDYPWTRPGPYVQIIVCDTGMGMDAETQRRIFEPFFTTKGPGKGTGLGLAVVYGIIKQYDGFITVSSTVGKGSIFTVFLPAQTVVSASSEPPTMPLMRGGSETILVVEDEPSLRQLATTILERLGYTVICAEDGLAAIELFSQSPEQIDLVILDLIMPRLGGREALARMRTLRPDVPAFFVTGYDSSAERSAAASKLASAPILAKPYRLDMLGLTVRQLLDSSS